ncbi:MAG: hypothetical protein NVSMB4_17170 [Acidimicrobiales bacterium]
MRCDDVQSQLATVVDGTSVLDRRAARHAGGCLRCQAELAHYRRLRRTLRQLADEPVAIPVGLDQAVIASLPSGRPGLEVAPLASPSRPWARRAAYAGAVAATAAGAAALLANRRRLRLAPA